MSRRKRITWRHNGVTVGKRCDKVVQATSTTETLCGAEPSSPYVTGKVGGSTPQPVWRCTLHKPKKSEEVMFDGTQKIKEAASRGGS